MANRRKAIRQRKAQPSRQWCEESSDNSQTEISERGVGGDTGKRNKDCQDSEGNKANKDVTQIGQIHDEQRVTFFYRP